MSTKSTFLVTVHGTFRHAYLVEASTPDQAKTFVGDNMDTIQEWHQEHLGDDIIEVTSVDPATLTTLHEETLRDKTNWWLPVSTFINDATKVTTPVVVEETEDDHVDGSTAVFDLEHDLVKAFWTRPEFTQLVRNENFMRDLYGALCNREWWHEDDTARTRPWSCSWRYAGGVVSDIRNRVAGLNECYMDYYCSGNEGTISDSTAEMLAQLGWSSEPVVVSD